MIVFSIALTAGLLAGVNVPGPCPASTEPATEATCPDRLDPVRVFDRVVSRYRSLTAYEDSTRIEEVRVEGDAEPTVAETRVTCAIADGRLDVRTPGEQAREAAGIDLSTTSPRLEALRMRYRLWLAPHLGLRFLDEPLEGFRAGVEEGFRPVEAERVVVDERELLRVQLRSGASDHAEAEATFDLFVNPESLLIVRVEGRERLPGGGRCETTFDITPLRVERAETDAV